MLTDIIKEYFHIRTVSGVFDFDLRIKIHVEYPFEDKKFRMSDAGRCRLYRYWKRQGKEMKPPDTSNMLTMEAGNVLHSWIGNAIEGAGYLIESEGLLEDADRVGHFDVLFEYEGKTILADLKTVNGKKMYYLKKNGNSPDLHHVYQLISYWYAIEEEQIGDPILNEGEHIDHTCIFYVNRDNWSEIHEVEIERKPLLISQIQDDWEILLDAWKVNTEPKANPEDWECRFCPFKSICTERR